MTVGAESAAPHPTKELPPPPAAPLWSVFCFSLVCLGLFWLPLAVLQQVDALLRFVTPLELASDVALLLVLLAVASGALAIVATLCGVVARRLGAGTNGACNLVWLLVLPPIGLACLWQSALTVKLWLEQVLAARLSTGSLPYRSALVVIIAVAMAMVWRSLGVTRVIRAITTPVLRLGVPAVAVTLLALACVLWQRPSIGMRSGGGPRSLATARSNAPDIFLITMDTLAAEDASICGTGPTNMPHLRKLVARSTCFTHHYAGSTLTAPSTTSLETSTLPWTHWVVHGGRPPADLAGESIAHMLKRAGYSANAITAAPGASPRQHGTYQAYDTAQLARTSSLNMSAVNVILEFPDSRSLPGLLGGVLSVLSAIDLARIDTENPYPSENVYGPAGRLLEQQGKGRPIFLWTHTWPPHAPYLPPASTKYQLLPPGQFDHYRDFLAEVGSYDLARQATVNKNRLRYQETIRGADESLDRFLQELERQGRLERALVIVTSDHGESFEHGVLRHGGADLHEALIRVPLLIKLPGQQVGRTIDTPTSQIDIAPTILELVGAEPIPTSEGRSLASALKGAPLEQAPVIAMAVLRESRFTHLTGGHYTVIEGKMKLVYHLAEDKSELYDLSADPRENRDISSAQPEVTTRLTALLKARIARAEAQRRQRFGIP